MKRLPPRYLTAVLTLAVVAALFGLWERYGSTTRVAFVNYPEYVLAPLMDQKLPASVDVVPVKWTEKSGKELKNYDMIVFFGMGLNFTEQQQKLISDLRKPLYVTASTRAETALDTLTKKQHDAVASYLDNGGKENFKRMLGYIRYEIDKKRFRAPAPLPPKERPRTAFFHDDDTRFRTFAEYLNWYRKSGHCKPGAGTVCLLSGNGGGDLPEVIGALEKTGLNVVAASGMERRIAMLEEVNPDLVVYQPHGRLSYRDPDAAIAFLKKSNIPLLCPIKVNQPYDEYLHDQRGMTGGMMSQSVTMPELDGGTTPFVLSALFRNRRGLLEYRVIPDRVERFAKLAEKIVALRRKPNAEKKIAIVYYKGPGQNALVAAGLEVGDSLLNTLRALKKAGFTTGPLPGNPQELNRQIQENAALFGTYAKGAMQNFLKHAKVATVTPAEYRDWVTKAMPADLYQTVVKRYGEFPGKYFNTPEGNLALGCLRFGNVVLLPQSLPGLGDDSNKLIHGAKVAPPHSYIATYLWTRYGFHADALLHFGTHGSLEFTPWKQAALSSYDWPDALIGEIPHYYLYVINNPGEALIAKRRSYATLVSHLTAPFMNAGGYGTVKRIQEKIRNLELAENPMLRNEYKKSIVELVKKEHIDRDLKLSAGFAVGNPDDDDLERIHNYLHEITGAKVNRGLYVIGRAYTPEQADETARLMTVDAVANRRFDADLAAGKATEAKRKNLAYFSEHYLNPAGKRIEEVLKHPETAPDDIAVRARRELLDSTRQELDSLVNAFSGGYIAPSPGGDPILNPDTVPTGRNLYGIDPERTPTRESYAVGKQLADALIAEKKRTSGTYPKKVAFTLWGGEFIRGQGTNIGEIFHLLGVEPVWDSRGRVQDVRLIPAKALKRPRIDVVVQTSGQFRGAATSRMRLIDKAVRLAAGDKSAEFGNFVSEGSLAAAKAMIASGMSPEQAKGLADARLFGGVDGNFGTGVTGMVQSGDRWEDPKQIAELYLHNMGALYTEGHWCEHIPGVFKAALSNTDTVVQSRSSNNWGPLSLDHVYEFTGGINLAVKTVIGREPGAYFNDLRTPGRAKIQEAGEAAMVEARSTLLNPKYIAAMMKEGPSGAQTFATAFENTYGWEVMKPDMLEDHLWEDYKKVYLDDSLKLGVPEYFRKKNPYALQQMTAVMLETVRKGYWKADAKTVRQIAETHAELVNRFGPGCSGTVCNNAKLRKMIAGTLKDPALKTAYLEKIEAVRSAARSAKKPEKVSGRKLKKETLAPPTPEKGDNRTAMRVILALIVFALLAVILGHRRRG